MAGGKGCIERRIEAFLMFFRLFVTAVSVEGKICIHLADNRVILRTEVEG